MIRPVIFHGHMYQPPREEPASRSLHQPFGRPKTEATGTPDKNWTARIYRECYRALMGRGPEQSAYRKMSFNLAPTLAGQLPPSFVAKLARANTLSAADQQGHPNALATSFHHLILPLAKPLDRKIQAYWGLEHYRSVFRREPEGFWLPEAAVDLASLKDLASLGLKFVIISPYSARRVKETGGWRGIGFTQDRHLPLLDHGVPYKVKLGPGSELNVFLYDPFLSQKLGFEDLLEKTGAECLAQQIDFRLDHHPSVPAAVDIETFGHHKKRGAAVLLDYFHRVAARHNHRPTNLGRLLAETLQSGTPIKELEIWSPSAWSCSHGVGRWAADCSCYGSNPWRAPLRSALNSLAGKVDRVFAQQAGAWLKDPDEARLKYVHVLLGQTSFEEFLARQQKPRVKLNLDRKLLLSDLFDLQVPRQAMFTSCAWFFEGMGYETHLALSFAGLVADRLAPYDPSAADLFRQLQTIKNSDGAAARHQKATALEVLQAKV